MSVNTTQQDAVVSSKEKYKRTYWQNDRTPLNAANLNNIENGIEQNSEAIKLETVNRKNADGDFSTFNEDIKSEFNEDLININLVKALNAESAIRSKVDNKSGITYDAESREAIFNEALAQAIVNYLTTNKLEETLLNAINAEVVLRTNAITTETTNRQNADTKIRNVVGINHDYTIKNDLEGKLDATTIIGLIAEEYNQRTENDKTLTSSINNVSNDLKNNYYNKTTVDKRITDAVSKLFRFKGVWITAVNGDIQNHTSGNNEGDVWRVGESEWVWDGSMWVELGPLINLEGYVTETQLDTKLGEYVKTSELEGLLPEQDPINIEEIITYGNKYPDETVKSKYYVKLDETEVIVKNEEQGKIDVKVVVNGTTYSSSAEYYREGNLVYVTGSVPNTNTTTLIKTFTSLVNLYFETTNDNFYKPVLNTDLKVVDTGSYSVIYNTNGVISKKDSTAPTLPDGGSFSFQFITKDPFYK